MATPTTEKAVQQTRYPIGPLSLAEMNYWEASARYQTARYGGCCVLDIVAWANGRKAETGIYPTFGHIDCRTRRWYRDVWHHEGEIGHRLTDNPHKIEIVEVG